MQEPSRNWFFEPHRDRDSDRHHDDDDDSSAPGLTYVPAGLLQRHGALVLNPSEAAAVPGSRTPRSTVYRARTLLIPADLLQDPAITGAINAVLARVGMSLILPAPGPGKAGGPGRAGGSGRAGGPGRADGPGRAGGILPRPAVLVPDGKSALGVVVDAWVALQALRAAAARREYPVLGRQVVRRIALEHLLIGAAITGSPIGGTGGGLTGSPADSSGVTGPGSTDSYLYRGGDTRAPVAVSLDAPARKTAKKRKSRRPVVAVLDTGVRAHPWLDVLADPAGPGGPAGGYSTVDDGFVAVDPDLQRAIYRQGQQAALAGDQPRQLIRHPWDTPVTADPLVGELDTDTGHGTFIAGIVRQVAPDAQVLAVRIMHSDGIASEGDIICALGQLAGRIALAEDGDLAAMVDVVSLSLGYFDESAADVTYSSGLWQAIEVLLGMGVAVVAAAGNYSTSRRFYPAAFTEQPPAGLVPMISVGALNPDGSKALFSNGGRWVTAWAPGAAVVSTFPVDIDGSRCPEISMRAHPANQIPAGVLLPGERAALDPDGYHGGFAVWSGTSFSAPLLAAHIARSLLQRAADPVLGLDLPGAQAAAGRVVAALRDMGWRG